MKDVFAGQAVGGASAERVAEFEDFIHATLPADYRRFLELYNGGVPHQATCLFRSDVELPVGNGFEVSQFFTLNRGHGTVLNLEKCLEDNLGWLGHTSIPIGSDEFGNLICLDTDTGHVEWLLLEERFTLDFSKTFEFGISHSSFLEELRPASWVEGPSILEK